MKAKIVGTKEELQDAFSVRFKVFVDEQKVPEEEEIDQFEDEAVHVVLYDGTVPAGAGRFRFVDGYAKVERICIMAQYRGKGAGKTIMDRIESAALEKGPQTFKLNAQTHAVPFYEKLGYSVVSEEFLDAGIPHVTMTKKSI
ncbi:GNAT family N-acetyltransferase [Bacillus lacus]|uniref:GNAT family N-acetyltransferase n=1 Tax=Metabacillus lacus TaxID=1983721 RepID=A0A7X2J188_9BACI|nr:GNAT family N-acetyltransferase [Metabacillus lacus]MRX73257.1 GNAT family N-acetyltransferase [Metabacillus lacus]